MVSERPQAGVKCEWKGHWGLVEMMIMQNPWAETLYMHTYIRIYIYMQFCWPPFLLTEEAELEEPGLFSKVVLVMCLEEWWFHIFYACTTSTFLFWNLDIRDRTQGQVLQNGTNCISMEKKKGYLPFKVHYNFRRNNLQSWKWDKGLWGLMSKEKDVSQCRTAALLQLQKNDVLRKQAEVCISLVFISLSVLLSVFSKMTIPNFIRPERAFPALCLWLSLWFLSPAPHQKVPINNLKLPSYLSSWDPEAWCFSPTQSQIFQLWWKTMTANTTNLNPSTLNTYLNYSYFTLQFTEVHHFFPKGCQNNPAFIFILHKIAFNFLV